MAAPENDPMRGNNSRYAEETDMRRVAETLLRAQ